MPVRLCSLAEAAGTYRTTSSAGCSTGAVQTVRAATEAQTERQLLYVACTRARDYLLVTSGAAASEFLEESGAAGVRPWESRLRADAAGDRGESRVPGRPRRPRSRRFACGGLATRLHGALKAQAGGYGSARALGSEALRVSSTPS